MVHRTLNSRRVSLIAGAVLLVSVVAPSQVHGTETSVTPMEERLTLLERRVAELENAAGRGNAVAVEAPGDRELPYTGMIYGTRRAAGVAGFWPDFWVKQAHDGP